MEWSAFFALFQAFGISWVGDIGLAGVIWTIAVVALTLKIGMGLEYSMIAGAAFVILFSAFMLPVNITAIIIIMLMIIFAAAVLRVLRR
jgi:Flp pilus assembly protein protease CpaA